MRYSTSRYIENKLELKRRLGLSSTRLDEVLRMEHDDALNVVTEPLMADYFSRQMDLNKNGQLQIDEGELFDLFDDVYFYKRSLHLITQRFDYDDNAPIDTTALEKLDKDVIIDTISDSGMALCVRVYHRDYPVFINGKKLDWSVDISAFIDAMKNPGYPTGNLKVDLSELNVSCTFHFGATDNLRKVYISKKSNGCVSCAKCKQSSVPDLFLRPRHCSDCKAEVIFNSNLMSILSTAMRAIEAYVNREKVAKKASKLPANDKVRSIMIAREDEGDTERVMPLIDYAYEYHESVRKEWQGGHHKSPVSHDRKGYFRKSKRGNYIRVDGEFVEVQKGTGNFTFVGPTKVKPDSDFVQKLIV